MHLCLSCAEGGGVITGFVHFNALTSTKFSLQAEMRVGFQAEEKQHQSMHIRPTHQFDNFLWNRTTIYIFQNNEKYSFKEVASVYSI